jgi:hypothetical protein
LYSSLDYIITLRSPCQQPGGAFLLRSSIYTNNFEWYRELYQILRQPCVKPLPPVCDVVVPDLDVHVRIPVACCDDPYKLTADDVKDTVLQRLQDVKEWNEDMSEWLSSDQVALCWKKYDRLEWIHATNAIDANRTHLIVGPQYVEEVH